MASNEADDWEEVPVNPSPEVDDWEEITPSFQDQAKEFGRGVVREFPTIGATIGGTLGMTAGSAVGGIGAFPGGVAGAAAGGAAGKALQNAWNADMDPENAPKETSELFTDPIQGAIDGATGEALGHGIGKGLGLAVDGAKYLGKKGLTLLGPSMEAVNARFAGRAKDGARSYGDLAESMGQDLHNLGNQVSNYDQKARDLLSNASDIPADKIIGSLSGAVNQLKIRGSSFGPVDKKITQVLDGLKTDLQSMGPDGKPFNISEQDLKGVIKRLDDNIDWSDQSKNKMNLFLKGIRDKYDAVLKAKNPAYGEAMIPVSRRMNVLDKIKSRFNFVNEPNRGLQPTDTTATKIQTSTRENKDRTQALLGDLKDYSGNDYVDASNDYRLAKEFNTSKLNGARRTLLGTAVGSAMGGPAGALIGAPLGAAADLYGGKWAGGIIDGIVKAGQWDKFGKYGPGIKEAASRGTKALSTYLTVLSRDPEFSRTLEDLSK